jgi:hypothetical protein
MVTDGRDEDKIIQDFLWNIENYIGVKKENFIVSAGPHGSAKHVTEIVVVF